MHNLLIITVSTRPTRKGHVFAPWLQSVAEADPDWNVSIADLGAIDLPMFDEPRHPRLGNYQHNHTKAWSQMVDAADAFVIVTPEYNYGAPPSIINALDFLAREWAYKPVGFVSYGGISGGMRAVQMLKQFNTTLKMMPIPEAVTITMFGELIDAEGKLQPTPIMETAAGTMLGELKKWTGALKTLRAA